MNYTFKASDVSCNGVGGAGYRSVMASKDLVEKIIRDVREQLGLDEIFNRITAADPSGEYYKGQRFLEEGAIVSRLITGIGNLLHSKFNDDLLVEMNAKHILETITNEDAITIVIDAHRDCASADHWYMFEKEWN